MGFLSNFFYGCHSIPAQELTTIDEQVITFEYNKERDHIYYIKRSPEKLLQIWKLNTDDLKKTKLYEHRNELRVEANSIPIRFAEDGTCYVNLPNASILEIVDNKVSIYEYFNSNAVNNIEDWRSPTLMQEQKQKLKEYYAAQSSPTKPITVLRNFGKYSNEQIYLLPMSDGKLYNANIDSEIHENFTQNKSAYFIYKRIILSASHEVNQREDGRLNNSTTRIEHKNPEKIKLGILRKGNCDKGFLDLNNDPCIQYSVLYINGKKLKSAEPGHIEFPGSMFLSDHKGDIFFIIDFKLIKYK